MKKILKSLVISAACLSVSQYTLAQDNDKVKPDLPQEKEVKPQVISVELKAEEAAPPPVHRSHANIPVGSRDEENMKVEPKPLLDNSARPEESDQN